MAFCSTSDSVISAFLQRCVGSWRSQRRYYTFNSSKNPILEAESYLDIIFLEGDRPALQDLAQRHQLAGSNPFTCGAQVTWHSNYTNVQRKPMDGHTIFGIKDDKMYRDRGFSTPKPVVATFQMPKAKILHFTTSYGGSTFEEEIKFVSDLHRTRQTIITKAGEESMIGQYLETRIS